MTPFRLARRLLWPIRHWPDRLLHSRRRAAIHSRLGSEPAPGVLVFVCLGNICRSPFAEQVGRRLVSALGLDLTVASAGFLASGRPSPELAREVAEAAGYDLSCHRSMSVAEVRAEAGVIYVVMEPRQAERLASLLPFASPRIVVLGDLDPWPIVTRSIPDPYGRTAEDFEACYARIERCVGELIGSLNLPA